MPRFRVTYTYKTTITKDIEAPTETEAKYRMDDYINSMNKMVFAHHLSNNRDFVGSEIAKILE